MLSGLLHMLGVMELFDRIKKLFETEKVVEGGKALYKRLDARFAEAARDEFWPWVDDGISGLLDRDPLAAQLLHARQLERHEYRASGGRFNALSETYMNEAFGRVFKATPDPEKRLQLFGQIARKDDRNFAAWLDAVTDDGFERYILFAADTVIDRVWPRLTEAEQVARNALRWVMGGALAFYLIFVFGEVTGNNAVHGLLFLGLLAGMAVAWWHGATIAVAVSAIQQTRSAMEVVAAGFAAATLMLVVGILVPFHLAPRELELASIITMPGLAFAAYWGFLKGMSSPLFTPKTVGFVFASVLLVTAFWAFNEKYEGRLSDTFFQFGESAGSLLPSAEASTLESEERSSCIATRSAGWSERTLLVDQNWSELQKIPPRSEFLVSSTTPVVVEFVDGSRYTVQPDACEGNGFGHHALAHFRARALDGEVASVTISHRSIK